MPHGLDKIPDVQGYLVLNSDGAVIAVSVNKSVVDIVCIMQKNLANCYYLGVNLQRLPVCIVG